MSRTLWSTSPDFSVDVLDLVLDVSDHVGWIHDVAHGVSNLAFTAVGQLDQRSQSDLKRRNRAPVRLQLLVKIQFARFSCGGSFDNGEVRPKLSHARRQCSAETPLAGLPARCGVRAYSGEAEGEGQGE